MSQFEYKRRRIKISSNISFGACPDDKPQYTSKAATIIVPPSAASFIGDFVGEKFERVTLGVPA
jgi:hypothetical protein